MLAIQQKGPVVLAVLWTETVLALTIITLRYYTRKNIGGQVGWDDWLLFATWFLMFAFSIICTVAAQHGFGIHLADIQPPSEFAIAMKTFLVGQSVVSIAMGTSKCAVAVFLLRIVNKMWHYIILWFWILSMMAVSILLCVSVFAQVTPVEALWDTSITKKTVRMNLSVIATLTCAWSAAMDFFLAIFPWMVLWQLNMRKKERVTICISLSLGLFAGICGIIRISTLDALSNSADYLWACSDSVCWTFSELTVTIVCVTAPALRPLWKRVTGQSSSGYGNYYKHSQSKGGFTSRSENGAINLDYMPGSSKLVEPTYAAQAGKASVHSDGNSDRSILRDGKNGEDAIHRVQEVTVTYDNISDDNSLSREDGRGAPYHPHAR